MSELKKILYAEDEEDIRTIVGVVISSTSQCEVDFAKNGRELLEKVENYSPDLVLLDVMMPEVDGPTALKKMRENSATKDIPVIFITAKAQLHELNELKSMGVLGIITKPFEPVLLFSKIKKLWDSIN